MNVNETKDSIGKNWQLSNPIYLDIFLIATKIICSFVGLPLNVFLAIIIIRLRRLNSKPRNIFLLGIIFSNLLAFLPALIELIYWNVPLESVCKAYIATVGLPYAILLWNMLLALVDRYVAITYPLWHRKKVTVFRAIIVLTSSTAFLTFLLKFVYLTGIAPLRCEIPFTHGRIIGWTMLVLLVLCIAVHLIVYEQTKAVLKESRKIHHPTNTLDSILKRHELVQASRTLRDPIHNTQIECTEMPKQIHESIERCPNVMGKEFYKDVPLICTIWNDENKVESSSQQTTGIQTASGTLSLMEMEATRTLITGVTSLFCITCPLIFFFLFIFFCRIITKSDCSNAGWLAPYFKELGLFHAVYNPMVYIFRNNELWSVLKTKIIISCSQKNNRSK